MDQRFECITGSLSVGHVDLMLHYYQLTTEWPSVFHFRGKETEKWASVCPATGQKVIPDEWKSLRRTQTWRTDKDGTWKQFYLCWSLGHRTTDKHSTHLHYPAITTSSAFQAEPSVCSLGQFNMMNEQMAASQLRSWVFTFTSYPTQTYLRT